MMCLPSIAKLHDRREADRKALKNSKTMTCDCCNEEFPTNAEGRYVEECWSPLISDKPSSIVTICPKCAAENEEKYGQPFGEEGEGSGYFMCAKCNKLNVYNYSWEVYATCTDDGYICQACAAAAEAQPIGATILFVLPNPAGFVRLVRRPFRAASNATRVKGRATTGFLVSSGTIALRRHRVVRSSL